MTPDAVPSAHSQAGPTRRTVLIGTVAVGIGLFGCGDGTNGALPTGGATTTGGAATPELASPTSGTTTVLTAKAADIPVGGGKIFDDQKVVVTQPTKGQFKAFTAICTHQGCTVSEVAEGSINCLCHGSRYGITNGSVTAGPAPRPLAEKTVSVQRDTITVT